MHSHTKKIAELALFTALAFIFSYVESLFPLPVPFPGIKLGLANLVIVILLYRSGFLAALGVSLVRNVLNALTFGNLFALLYSLAGSVLSLLAMEGIRILQSHTAREKRNCSVVTVSAVGGILHNAGQCIVAAALVGYEAILHYFPFLYFAGLAAGVLIGMIGGLCLKRFPD